MPSLLSPARLKELRPLLNYVNVSSGGGSELASFCKKHNVPTKIHIEEAVTRRIIPTKDTDRKAILLGRVIKYLETGEMPSPTIFRREVISDAALPNPLKSSDRVYYGQYKNGNSTILKVLKPLTNGISTFCAVGQEVIREFWAKGVAPTYAEFAKAFVEAQKAHKTSDNPEWAYLNDLQKAKKEGKELNKNEWRTQIRPNKAKQALDILNEVPVPDKKKKGQ